MADQAIHCRLMDDDACACRRRSRASLHRLSFSMTCISWPVRLYSTADCSSAVATGPARGAVKCVERKKVVQTALFLCAPLSSLAGALLCATPDMDGKAPPRTAHARVHTLPMRSPRPARWPSTELTRLYAGEDEKHGFNVKRSPDSLPARRDEAIPGPLVSG